MRHQHKILLAGNAGCCLRVRHRYTAGLLEGIRSSAQMLAVTLVGIAAGVMRLLVRPLLSAKKGEIGPARRPDPYADPNNDWSSDGSGCRTGYEISFEDF